MKNPIYLIIFLVTLPLVSVHASNSGSSGSNVSYTATQKLTPEQKAVVSHNAGVKHRDRALNLEKKALRESDPKKLAKLQKKIDRAYESSIREFRKAIQHYPGYYEVHGSLGYSLRKVGQHAESLEAYNESLRLNPSYGAAIEYRGEAYLGLGRLEDAKKAYMTLFQNEPALADELLAAMIAWVSKQRADPKADKATVEAFASWIDQRGELASYIQHGTDTTSKRWDN